MKTPVTPPPWTANLDLSKAMEIPAFREWMGSPLVRKRYRHWDKLRRLAPPDGLTHELWWAAIKLSRYSGRQTIPLRPVSEAGFYSFILPPVAHEYLYDLSVGLGGKFQVPERVVNKDTQDQYYVSSLMEESITSSQLEGATTTRKVAEDMLRSGRSPRTKSEQMIYNNYKAMNRIGELTNEALSPSLVFELHRILTDRTLDKDDEAGRFRRADEQIRVEDNETGEIVHTPPPAHTLDERMKLMCDFANHKDTATFLHPIVRAIILHFWLAYDHPFTDGNGRVARALFYWSMRKAGHWLCEYVSISSVIRKGPARYSRAFLYTETDDNDLTYFILYQLHVLQQATQQLHEYIQHKSAKVQELAERLKGLVGLGHRQREIIIHALRHPHQEYTIESHRASHNVVYQTARRDLLDLVSKGYLTKLTRGKEFVFMPDPHLEQKLKRAR